MGVQNNNNITRISILFLAAALVAFYVVQISPEKSWVFGFIGYSIPLLLIIHGLLLLYWLLRRSWKVVLPLAALIIGWQYVRSSIQANPATEDKDGLNIINYNVRVFNVYDHLKKLNPTASAEMIDWLVHNDAAILCLQEYYNEGSSSVFNTEVKITKGGFNYSYVSVNTRNRIGAEFGLAIFSKIPIINRGVVPLGETHQNKAIFADMVYQEDTIRIYNVHLYSMKLRVDDWIKEEEKDKRIDKTKETFYRIRKGFKRHAKEADRLKEHVLASPYPVVITGDFNELPYSYTYLSFNDFLQNSFEEAGNGLGFTYRENPSFIRIDNQFSDKTFDVVSHKVHNDLNYSDHYPISVIYRLNNNKKQ